MFCFIVSALDTPNVHPKKVVTELLTVVYLYSKKGQEAVNKAFNNFKVRSKHNIPHLQASQ